MIAICDNKHAYPFRSFNHRIKLTVLLLRKEYV